MFILECSFIVHVVYRVHKGIEVVARTAELFIMLYTVLTVAGISAIVFGGYIKVENLFPIMLAIMTGMRQGEILGLRWRDIDFEKKVIFIKQIPTHDGKELRIGTKTISGTRTITVSDNL